MTTTKSVNIAVFASHGGSDLQAVIDACKAGKLKAEVRAVISNNADSTALQRARDNGIPAYHFDAQNEWLEGILDTAILNTLKRHDVQIVFLAGYLKKLGTKVSKAYEGSVYNIHPSLLPKYGGKGMYGLNVHKAVINAGETETGITIHRVTGEYDAGEIIAQRKVAVLKDDTPETLAARVLEQEHIFIVETLAKIIGQS